MLSELIGNKCVIPCSTKMSSKVSGCQCLQEIDESQDVAVFISDMVAVDHVNLLRVFEEGKLVGDGADRSMKL